MPGTTNPTHRLLMTFDVTDWPEASRIELQLCGDAIARRMNEQTSTEDPPSGSAPAVPDATPLHDLVTRLRRAGRAPQAQAVEEAFANGGSVDRDRIYVIGGYPQSRSLRGWTRPINRIVEQMRSDGTVPADAPSPTKTTFDPDVRSYQRAQGLELAEDLGLWVQPLR